MLEGIRAAQSTWIGKALMTLVFGLIVLAFVVWGIGDVFRGGGGNQVAQVGGVGITTAAYRQAYQTQLQNLQQRARRQITNDEAHRLGLDVQVLSRLMSDAALDDRAKTLGLGISDSRVAKSILTDPSFAGPGGAFDRSRFNAVLRDNGFNEQSFVREQRQTDLRQEFVQALIGGLTVPAAAVDALHRYEAETRSLDYTSSCRRRRRARSPRPTPGRCKPTTTPIRPPSWLLNIASWWSSPSRPRPWPNPTPSRTPTRRRSTTRSRMRDTARPKPGPCSRSCFLRRARPGRPRPASRRARPSTTS